ncbi:MAG: hypothetical protein ABSB30_14130 [Terracidiphilus sp.]|jgi:hypothetical protein
MFPSLRIAILKTLPCICLAFLALASCAQLSAQVIPRQTDDLLQRQISWDENLPSAKNPNGLSFQFYKTDETTTPGKRVAHYRAYIFGAPEKKRYTLTVWRIGSEPRIFSNDVHVNAKGLLMTHEPSPEQENSDFVGDDEFHLAVQAARAEPVRYALSSSDKGLLVYGTVVPFPREDTNRECRLEVRLALSDASMILIYADGLPANTEIPFQLLSANVSRTEKFSVNAQGHAVAIGIPSTGGKDRGLLTVTLATSECSVAVDLPWGEGSYRPM